MARNVREEATDNWIVLRSTQSREMLVDQVLSERGNETYLPTVRQYIVRRKRKEPTPFFPSYLFARVDLGSIDYGNLQWTPGLSNVVKFGGCPATVPDELVSAIRERLASLDEAGYFDRPAPYQPGERVHIKSGPLAGMDALFDRQLSQRGRVRVFLDMLGRLTACDIEQECLEKARQ